VAGRNDFRRRGQCVVSYPDNEGYRAQGGQPIRPQRLPLPLSSGMFYGWVIVATAWLANMVTATMNPLVFSIFIDPMKDDLNVKMSALAWLISIRMVTGGIASPLMGRLIDSFGARWLGFFGGLLCGASLIGMYFAGNIWVMYALFAISGVTGFGTVGGQLLTIVPVANWFVAKRGRATSIAATGMMMGTATGAVLAQLLIHTVGWRWTWVIFGLAILTVVVPTYGFLMRRHPEDLGLYPDGVAPQTVSVPHYPLAGPRTTPVEVDWTLNQAVRTPVLWLILLGLTMHMFSTSAALFLRVPFWNDLGVSPQVVGLGVAADPFTVMFAILLLGSLSERYPVRFMAVIGGIWRGISMIPLLTGGGHAFHVFSHTITWGIGSAGFVAVQNLMIPTYFGRLAQGSIRGVTAPLLIAAGALGSPFAGYMMDAGVKATFIWQLSLGLMVTAGLMFFFLKPPERPQELATPQAESTPGRTSP